MRIAVFIDYWNFQLSINKRLSSDKKVPDYRAKIDWKNVGPLFALAACPVLACEASAHSFEGTYIYTSYNPITDEGRKFKNWATTWLNRQPGINVEIRERKSKSLPVCPACHKEISNCPHAGCEKPIVATVEKGIDTLLVTDLIRLAVSNSYDAAVLVSSDADMVPAVEFVQTLGKKVIQAGFPPTGVSLATQCWGSFDVIRIGSSLERD